MAIYRPPKRRWPALVACLFGGAIVGLVAGLLIGSGDPDPAEAVAPAKQSLNDALIVLDVLDVEYSEAVSGGSVQNRSEYDGARSALERSRAAFEDARPALQALDPQRAEAIGGAYAQLQGLVADAADPSSVSAAIVELKDALKGNQ